MTDAIEQAARVQLRESERDLLWLLVEFGKRVTAPLLAQNNELAAKLSAQRSVESAIMEEFCRMEERLKQLEMQNEVLRAHAENGLKWIEAYRAAEERAEVFAGFYDKSTIKLLEERLNEYD